MAENNALNWPGPKIGRGRSSSPAPWQYVISPSLRSPSRSDRHWLMRRQPAWRKPRRAPSFWRSLFIRTNIAGTLVRPPGIRHDTQQAPHCLRRRHDPHARQRLCLRHDPNPLAMPSNRGPNVDIRHASSTTALRSTGRMAMSNMIDLVWAYTWSWI